MAAAVYEIGTEKNRVLVVDDFMDDPGMLIAQAKALAPFPPETQAYYPGLRHLITPEDGESHAHVRGILEALVPAICQVFDVVAISPVEATYSLVTTRPEDLVPAQRLPHYDHVDPNLFAILCYLSPDAAAMGGTSFYRHKATGFERISLDRNDAYLAKRREETERFGEPPLRYFAGNDQFKNIGRFEGRFNRLLVYRGSLLHSGDILDGCTYSDDPEKGRLTCNIFFKAMPR